MMAAIGAMRSAVWLQQDGHGGAGVQSEASLMVQVSAESKRVMVGRRYMPKVDSTRFAFYCSPRFSSS